jgi:hypothetical protein
MPAFFSSKAVLHIDNIGTWYETLQLLTILLDITTDLVQAGRLICGNLYY